MMKWENVEGNDRGLFKTLSEFPWKNRGKFRKPQSGLFHFVHAL